MSDLITEHSQQEARLRAAIDDLQAELVKPHSTQTLAMVTERVRKAIERLNTDEGPI